VKNKAFVQLSKTEQELVLLDEAQESVYSVSIQKNQKINKFSFRVLVGKISAGSNHLLALMLTGQLFSWGSNKQGQLGHGDFEE